MDIVSEAIHFLLQQLGRQGTALLLLVFAAIYIWYQHHRMKLLEEQLSFLEKRRGLAAHEMEQFSKSLPLRAATQDHVKLLPGRALGTVVVADDEEMMCQLIADYLREKFPGISVVTANDGEKALQHISNTSPSCVILDLMMPRKTGYEVIKELVDRGEKFPIIAISAYAEGKEEIVKRAMVDRDRVEFFQKPVSLEELTNCLNKLILERMKE